MCVCVCVCVCVRAYVHACAHICISVCAQECHVVLFMKESYFFLNMTHPFITFVSMMAVSEIINTTFKYIDLKPAISYFFIQVNT